MPECFNSGIASLPKTLRALTVQPGKFLKFHQDSHWVSWVTWLLAEARTLKALELKAEKWFPLPVLPGLAHLILHMQICEHDYVTLLSSVPNLQTLMLCGTVKACRDGLKTVQMPAGLKHLCLDDAVLSMALSLPPECSVHLNMSLRQRCGKWSLERVVREMNSCSETSAAQRVSSLSVTDADFALWTALYNGCEALSGISSLSISGGSLVIMSLAKFACLSLLFVEAADLEVVIPASKHLTKICVRSGGSLRVKFEDPALTAKYVQSFAVRCEPDVGSEDSRCFARHLRNEGKALVGTMDAGFGLVSYRLSKKQESDGWEGACGCMCCMDCLKRTRAV